MRISSENNLQADALARLASSTLVKLSRTMTIFELANPSVDKVETTTKIVYQEGSESWITPIVKYLQTAELLCERSEAKKIVRKSSRYMHLDGKLYRRGFSLPYLRYIDSPKTKGYGGRVYRGTYESHSEGRTLAHRII
ncbi:hypothetical protein ACOSQ3_010650 [Xanthoceras sorbifolium]